MIKNKKGISVMIGYVLLIGAAIFMSFVVYTWMKSYLPKDQPECPDDVSLAIGDILCDDFITEPTGPVINELRVDITNNGLFAIKGYSIKGRTDFGDLVDIPNLEEATYYTFAALCNPTETNTNLGREFGGKTGTDYTLSSIEIIPTRDYVNDEGKNVTAICTNSKVSKKITPCVLKIPD